MIKLIYHLTLHRSKCYLIQKYGKDFWKQFKANSDKTFAEILPQVPDIGYSIFSSNYEFGPSYIAWYKTFLELGVTQDETIQNIWTMNEKMVTTIPRPFLKVIGRLYLSGLRKKAAAHMIRQEKGYLHLYDWAITYHEIDQNSFELDIAECGLKKLAHQFKADGLLPGICRMDYLLSNLMGNGFVRTKTLGDGNDCCNCHYDLVGKCEWSPEKGFIDRK
ncbi:MAG TPA: L-2-amino-thiazoline-4-carboxylic acid hydrolase [Pseudobacteroides sp.]|uniref:L-2-amino-thiazoline-4-carboxylic acid hydrolase n=1 Tax=Pseudobacteroides sp. TaxID=1968840 RepID=UPI002F944DE4